MTVINVDIQNKVGNKDIPPTSQGITLTQAYTHT